MNKLDLTFVILVQKRNRLNKLKRLVTNLFIEIIFPILIIIIFIILIGLAGSIEAGMFNI